LSVVVQDLQVPDWPCPTGECRYKFSFRSAGPDCAINVRGTLRLFQADGITELARDEWALDAGRVVRPSEHVDVEDGPLPLTALAGVGDEGQYAVLFQFDAIRCE
jgi:hypothetical protein